MASSSLLSAILHCDKSCKKRNREEDTDLSNSKPRTQTANPILIPLRGLRGVPDRRFSIAITPKFDPSSANKGSLEVVIPKILRHETYKKFCIEGFNSSLTKPWIEFAVEYLTTIAENWSRIPQVRQWIQNYNSKLFSISLQLLWERAGKEKRFWKIAKSKVKPNRNHWKGSSGSGLFCTRAGKHKIEFGMLPETHWADKAPANRSLQQSYAIGPEICDAPTGGKKILRYLVPSKWSLTSGLISCGFKVNCEDERWGKPTHSLVFERGSPYLKPLRTVEVGEEFTYDYRYYLDAKTLIGM